jgi:predicted dehydrogenase
MLRIGVVGYGLRMSTLIAKVLHPLNGNVRIVGIVDPDEQGVRNRLEKCDSDVVFYASLEDMIKKARLDGLMIGTRCNLHTPQAIVAARYDIPLFLEKPVAISMEQANALEEAFHRSSCKVVVSFPLRCSPLLRHACDLIKDGAIGTAEHIHAVNYVPYGTVYWELGYRDYSVTQGLFLQKATHDFDYISMLMGARIVRVAAMANYGRVFGGNRPAGLTCDKCDESRECLESPENRRHNGSSSEEWALRPHACVFGQDCGNKDKGINEDCSSVLLEFESGTHGVYSQVFFSRRDAASRGSVVSGYKGTVSFDWYTNKLKRVWHHKPFTDVTTVGNIDSHFGGDIELMRNFLDVLQGNAQSVAPVATGIQSVYACLAAKESALQGCFVKVREVGF